MFSPPHPYLRRRHKHKRNEEHIPPNTLFKTLTINDYGFYSNFREREKRFYNIIENISFRLIHNDNTPQNLIWLLAAKNIFEMELFNLTPDYITSLVFNKYHQTLILLEKGDVIGGICFRVFDKLSELVFCAVSNKFKSKGYGSYMMALFKNYMQFIGVTDIFTYADNNARIFFSRHGFSLHCSMPESEWKGKLKDYSGASLVSAHIYPMFDYVRSDFILNKQIIELEKFLGKCLLKRVNKWPINIIDGIKIEKYASANLLDNMIAALYKIRQIPTSDLFFYPITFPEYLEVIKRPMDFKTITDNLIGSKEIIYSSFDEFEKDVNQIFINCKIYNKTENAYTIAADSLYPAVQKILSQYRI